MHIPCTVSIIAVRIAKADWRSAVQKAAAVYKPELVKLIRSSQFSAESRGKKKMLHKNNDIIQFSVKLLAIDRRHHPPLVLSPSDQEGRLVLWASCRRAGQNGGVELVTKKLNVWKSPPGTWALPPNIQGGMIERCIDKNCFDRFSFSKNFGLMQALQWWPERTVREGD